MNGLGQLNRWISCEGDEEQQLLGEGAQLRKLKLKLIQLLGDLITNDESILHDGLVVRDYVATNMVDSLLRILKESNVRAAQEAQLRIYTLNALYRIK